MNKNNFSAFTIIELAIVTVIIALIVGAIYAGGDLIKSSNRSTLIKEINQYKAAIHNFNLQYEQLPGDMDNASDYWSSASEGEGNGYITGSATENRYAWDHLSKANILDQSFDSSSIFKDRPESAIGDAYYKLETAGSYSGANQWGMSTNTVYEKSGNYIGIGAPIDGGGAHHPTGFINGSDAESIDRKIDDGHASAGSFVAIRGITWSGSYVYQSGCVDGSNTGYNASNSHGQISYDLSDSTESCRVIYFLKGFE